MPPYNLFEFALIHVAAKSKRPPEIGCSFHNCVPKLDHGNVPTDHCFLVTQRVGSESRGEKNPNNKPTKKRLAKFQKAQLFQDRLWPAFLRHKVGDWALPAASMVLPSPFF